MSNLHTKTRLRGVPTMAEARSTNNSTRATKPQSTKHHKGAGVGFIPTDLDLLHNNPYLNNEYCKQSKNRTMRISLAAAAMVNKPKTTRSYKRKTK